MAVADNVTRTNRETGTRVLYFRDEKDGVIMACLTNLTSVITGRSVA